MDETVEGALILGGAPAQAHTPVRIMGSGPAQAGSHQYDGIAAQSIARRSEADNDTQLIALWLHGRSPETQRAYYREVGAFLAFSDTDLRGAGLLHLQRWAESPAMQAKAPSSRARAIAAVKSLFKFALGLGYVAYNVALPLRSPKVSAKLAERILSESAIQRIIAKEEDPRNAMILRLLYASAIRVSELCGLTWSSVKARDGGMGQITVLGKGEKERAGILSASVFAGLMALRPEDAKKTDPVFASRKKGGHLTAVQVLRIVRASAARAGVEGNVSPHWFRHAHASHSLQRGATIMLVQSTLGHSNVATTSRYLHALPNDSSGLLLPV